MRQWFVTSKRQTKRTCLMPFHLTLTVCESNAKKTCAIIYIVAKIQCQLPDLIMTVRIWVQSLPCFCWCSFLPSSCWTLCHLTIVCLRMMSINWDSVLHLHLVVLLIAWFCSDLSAILRDLFQTLCLKTCVLF